MKLTVIGGTGLTGSQVVGKLTAAGHQAVPAALSTGLDLITGQGLDQALEGAEVVVNVANPPTFDEASLGFFRRSATCHALPDADDTATSTVAIKAPERRG
jgi:uncharacterized protein YbjT (DUF2867 family)